MYPTAPDQYLRLRHESVLGVSHINWLDFFLAVDPDGGLVDQTDLHLAD